MKLKQMLLWQWKANRTAFLIFYCIIAVVTTVGTIIVASLGQVAPATAIGGVQSGASFAIIEMDTGTIRFGMVTMIPAAIFLFIAGLASFGENLRVALANGASRRTNFKSLMLFILAASVLTSGICLLLDSIPRLSPGTYFPMFSEGPGELFVYFFSISLFALSLGHFIAGGYYRMNTLAKILVSVCVPVLLIYLLSVGTSSPLYQFSDWMIDDWNASLFLCGCSAILLTLGWLLMRRAPIKPPTP